MSDNLYEYAVILDPTEAEEEEGKRAELVSPPTAVLAADEAQVRMIAARQHPDLDLRRIRVVVRPF